MGNFKNGNILLSEVYQKKVQSIELQKAIYKTLSVFSKLDLHTLEVLKMYTQVQYGDDVFKLYC